MVKIRVGLIEFGRMERFYLKEIQKSGRWDVAYVCDINPDCRELAKQLSPESKILESEQEVFDDESVQVVGLFTLTDSRLDQIEKAIKYGKYIISKKPVLDTIDKEWKVVDITEKASCFSTINLYLHNAWYHQTIEQFIDQGEIGELAVLRICHVAPGLAPGKGHEYEGPTFHDCGVHYVDIARWYTRRECKTWHAQGVNMWSYKDPWWVQCHGTFQNDVVFDIAQGLVYGQLSKDQTHNSYVDITGTRGIARMAHDFKTAVVNLRGVTQTHHIEKPFDGKSINVLFDLFVNSIETGIRNPQLLLTRDLAIASKYAWTFLHDAYTHDLSVIDELETLEQIWERGRNMKNRYGLLRKP